MLHAAKYSIYKYISIYKCYFVIYYTTKLYPALVRIVRNQWWTIIRELYQNQQESLTVDLPKKVFLSCFPLAIKTNFRFAIYVLFKNY